MDRTTERLMIPSVGATMVTALVASMVQHSASSLPHPRRRWRRQSDVAVVGAIAVVVAAACGGVVAMAGCGC
eukprot:15465936-Alexandrium_andersonii.AAC.1